MSALVEFVESLKETWNQLPDVGPARRRRGLTESLGLGLHISRTLARLMGGDITYSRRDGETLFELSLPKASPQ